MAHKQLASWAWQYRYLIVFYYLASLLLGSVLGAIRGISERDRRIGTWLAVNRWLGPFLVRFGVLAFLEEAPYGTRHGARKSAMRACSLKCRRRWRRARRKRDRTDEAGAGFYTGELKSYGMVSDSEPNKDFLLVNAAYKKTEESVYVPMDVDGVLLNFADAKSMAIIKEKSV
jgi:hypothetical protein